MLDYIVEPDQSLFDIAVEAYGDVAGVFWLLADNADRLSGLTDRLLAGQVLAIRNEAINIRQAVYLRDFGPFQTITEADRPVGIEFWYLEEYLIG